LITKYGCKGINKDIHGANGINKQVQMVKNYLREYVIDGANCHDKDDGGRKVRRLARMTRLRVMTLQGAMSMLQLMVAMMMMGRMVLPPRSI
jgi:hypothetical protein